MTTALDLSVTSLLPLASTDDIAKLGWEFLADAFLAFAYGGGGGIPKVSEDGVGVAEVHAQSADEFLVVEITIVEQGATRLTESVEQGTLHCTSRLVGEVGKFSFVDLHGGYVIVCGCLREDFAALSKCIAQPLGFGGSVLDDGSRRPDTATILDDAMRHI